jgi:hypothetical protein
MAAAQPVRGVCFPLEAGGAIYVEQLDEGSVEIRDELPGLKPSLVRFAPAEWAAIVAMTTEAPP